MAATVYELSQDVKQAIGVRSDISDTQILRYLNLATERIAREEEWPELRQVTDVSITASGTKEEDKSIDLSGLANLDQIYNFVIEDDSLSRRLQSVPPDEFDKRIPLPEYLARGTPLFYTLWTPTIALIYPVPTKAYTGRIRWLKWQTVLTGSDPFVITDTDTPDLLRKDDMIVFLAVSYIFALLREETQADKYFGYYMNSLNSANKKSRRTADLRVRPSFLGALQAEVPEYWVDPFNRRAQ